MSFKDEFRSRISNLKRKKETDDENKKSYNSNEFFCSICNLWLDSKEKFEQHKKDESHIKKVIRFQTGGAKKRKPPIEESETSANPSAKTARLIEENTISKPPMLNISLQDHPKVAVVTDSGKLPEGFFDNAELDAKARNVKFVDKFETLYDRFRKHITEDVQKNDEITNQRWEETEIMRDEEELIMMEKYIKRMYDLRGMVDQNIKQSKIPHNRSNKSNDQTSEHAHIFEEDDMTLDWRCKNLF